MEPRAGLAAPGEDVMSELAPGGMADGGAGWDSEGEGAGAEGEGAVEGACASARPLVAAMSVAMLEARKRARACR
jgi:hypothetical protein